MNVKQIEAKDTYAIRSEVLREDLPIETCYFEGDKDDSTFHLGGYINDKLCSIASFYLTNNPKIESEFQFQLRGMATLLSHRGNGLSSALLKTAFPLIKQNHVKVLWCNARAEAVGFYKKVGFKVNGDEFLIEGVGPHFLMSISI